MLRIISQIRSTLTVRSLPQTLICSTVPHSQQQLRPRHHQDLNAGDEDPMGNPPRLLVLQPRLRPDTLLKTKLDEALNLASSLEQQRDEFFSDRNLPPHIVVQNPVYRSPHADTFFGPGTVQTIMCYLNNIESKGEVDAIYVNSTLTGIQQRNLERQWGKPVLDRVGLIIEIFHAHAQTKEAKLQAELAALMYKRSRLVRARGPGGRYAFGASGEAEVVSARGHLLAHLMGWHISRKLRQIQEYPLMRSRDKWRGSGGQGFISGAGETELQLQRRRILERRNQLLSEIKEVRRRRALQRASRRRHGGSNGEDMATVAVVGYTNAGKSTLVSTLSETHLFCDDRLFATVDPKLRSVILPSGKKVLLSDTVGFISELPVQLVEAFHATLEEVVEADLLVHVMDSSAPDRNEQREAVLQVLHQIGVSKEKLQNMIEVWNKIDIGEEKMAADEYNEEKEGNSYPSAEDEDTTLEDEQVDYSDGRLSPGDGEVTWDDQNASTMVGQETREDQQKESYIVSNGVGKDLQSQSEPSPHVKISAITGVGLQELLELIDEKLKTERVVERGVFNRKWRPPRAEDSDVAVGE